MSPGRLALILREAFVGDPILILHPLSRSSSMNWTGEGGSSNPSFSSFWVFTLTSMSPTNTVSLVQCGVVMELEELRDWLLVSLCICEL